MENDESKEKEEIIKKTIALGAIILVIIVILALSFSQKGKAKKGESIATLECVKNSTQEIAKSTRTFTFQDNKLVKDEALEEFYDEDIAIEYEEDYVTDGKYINIARNGEKISYTNESSIFLGESMEYVKKVIEMSEEYDEITEK